ncbi:MAG: hypothetical protein Q4B60_09000 [Erysipelotrichaceae bacterium]|nr:hypothetical protein [Erysipelotrichaceae bacterium]
MNQAMLIGKLVDVVVLGSELLHLMVEVEFENSGIFTVECKGPMAKADFYKKGQLVAVKARLKMDDTVHLIAQKVATIDTK